MSISEREKAIRQRLKDDFVHYADKCLKIRTKDGEITPFKLNQAQLYIHDQLEQQLADTGKIRAIILKGRQQGCSTYTEGRFLWKTTHRLGVKAFILTHHSKATTNLFDMVKRYYEKLPELVKPSISATNATALVFNKLDSGYAVGTARSKDTGRSDTIQYFHGSEVAFWENGDMHLRGVMQTIPNSDGSEVILESTSDGAKGLFYDMAMDSYRGSSDYNLIFVPWFWQEEYSRQGEIELDNDEIRYKKLYNLSDSQMLWRRYKITELNGISNFEREYPATVEEAFKVDVKGALWTRRTIEQNRVHVAPELKRIIVAVDPAVTSKESSDETGIVVAGIDYNDHGYVLEDQSGIYTPNEWANIVVGLYKKWEADRIVTEVNQGGDLLENTLRTVDRTVSYRGVRASRGKRARAEPVASLFERGLIHHVGAFTGLEDQMCTWDASSDNNSPDRVDALVWAMTDLMLGYNEVKSGEMF